MIRREYYYSYGNAAISGVPDEKRKARKLVSSSNNNRVNDFVDFGAIDGEIKLQTADGFSEGNTATGNRPRMRAKWEKDRTLGKGILEQEEDRKRQEVIDDISSNFRDLKTNNATWLVDFRES